MEIIIIAITDTQVERVAHIMFPNPVDGMQAMGIIEQIAINRQKSSIDRLTLETLAQVGQIEIGHFPKEE